MHELDYHTEHLWLLNKTNREFLSKFKNKRKAFTVFWQTQHWEGLVTLPWEQFQPLKQLLFTLTFPSRFICQDWLNNHNTDLKLPLPATRKQYEYLKVFEEHKHFQLLHPFPLPPPASVGTQTHDVGGCLTKWKVIHGHVALLYKLFGLKWQ